MFSFMNPMNPMKSFNTFMSGPQAWMRVPAEASVEAMKVAGMDPTKLMLQQCETGMGKMGAGMFDMMGGLMPGANGIMVREMKQMMYNPAMVHRAIYCAQQNFALFNLLKKAIWMDSSLLHFLGGQVVEQKAVALEVMNLVLKPAYRSNGQVYYPGAELFLNNIDPVLFTQVTYAMEKYPEIVLPMIKMIKLNKERAFHFRGPLMRSVMTWGRADNAVDGVEVAFERFINSVMSSTETALAYFDLIESVDTNTKHALLDVLFLGHRFSFANGRYIRDELHAKNRSQYHVYAVIDGLYSALVLGTNPGQRMSLDREELMMGLMSYMAGEDKKITSWGSAFLRGIVNASLVHSELPVINAKPYYDFCSIGGPQQYVTLDDKSWRPSEHQQFFCFLGHVMKHAPGFRDSMPVSDVNSVGPRSYFTGHVPFIPQRGVYQ